MHITVTGMLGSGKSTICRIISEQKDFEIYSTGKMQRLVASQKSVTTLELNKMMKEQPELDSIIDNETIRIAEANPDKTIIFDSRMAWFFVKDSYRIFITVDPYVAAQRVVRADRGQVEGYLDVEEAMEKLLERAQTEHERFIRIYNADYWDYCNYDLVLDATWHDPETLASVIMGQMDMFMEEKNQKRTPVVMMSPKSLYPAISLTGKNTQKVGLRDWNTSNVYIISEGHYNFIIKGQGTVLRALENKTELIRVKCVKKEQITPFKIDKESIKLFEKLGEFKFMSCPYM